MIQDKKDKELLLKDLCTRLPYGVLIQEEFLEHVKTFLPDKETDRLINIDVSDGTLITNGGSRYHIYEVKPYLFPIPRIIFETLKELKEEFEEKTYYC